MIRFSCPGCGAVFSVSDDKAGKTGNCPKCQTKFTIPAAEAPAPAPPPASSNPFSDLGDDAPKKKKPSKADLDDDLPRKKKPSSKADLDDEDDRPKKKPARRDDEDDAPPPKKKPARAVDDDEDDRPRKKSRRDDDEDDYDDRPKKKSARRDEDDYDDEDDRPRKKGRGRDDDYDDEDDYDDRPRKRKGKSGLLLTAAILHIIYAALYIPCGVAGLIGSGVVGAMVEGGSAGVKVTGGTVRASGKSDPEFEKAMRDFDKVADSARTAILLLQIISVLAILSAILAIPAAVAGFTKKGWFKGISLAAGGIAILLAVLHLVVTFMTVLAVPSLLMLTVLPLAYGVLAVLAATNKNVKRVLA